MYNDVRPSARRLVAVEIGTFDCVIDLPRINDLGIERAVPVRHLEDDGGMRKPRKLVHESARRQVHLIRVEGGLVGKEIDRCMLYARQHFWMPELVSMFRGNALQLIGPRHFHDLVSQQVEWNGQKRQM